MKQSAGREESVAVIVNLFGRKTLEHGPGLVRILELE